MGFLRVLWFLPPPPSPPIVQNRCKVEALPYSKNQSTNLCLALNSSICMYVKMPLLNNNKTSFHSSDHLFVHVQEESLYFQDLSSIHSTAEEMELFALVNRKFKHFFIKQEHLMTFRTYDHVEVKKNWSFLLLCHWYL